MIKLCYLNPILKTYDFLNQLTNLFNSLTINDLVIKAKGLGYKNKHNNIFLNTISPDKIDFEKLASQEIKNLVLLNFDDIDSKIIRNLINLKSKKSEIIGISNSYNKEYKKLQLEVQEYKDQGMTLDQLSVMLTLRNNLPPSLVQEVITNPRSNIKNLNVKEIQSIEEIKKFLKY